MYTGYCYIFVYVRPANETTVTGVALYHNKVGRPWYKQCDCGSIGVKVATAQFFATFTLKN